MDAFDAYKLYVSLKNHFTTKTYDFFKYNGSIKASKESFEKRHDRYFFHKLSKRKDVLGYLVANFVSNSDVWVGDIIQNETCEAHYRKYLKYKESITYQFSEDLDKLNSSFNDNFKVVDGQHPELLKKYMRGQINIETMIILNDLIGFMPMWNRKIEDKVVWPELYLKCKKYRPFIEFDKTRLKQIVVDKFSD
jgi:hypothetical protein